MNKRNLVLQAAIGAALVSAFGAAHASSIGRSAAAAGPIAAYAGDYTIAAESTAANYAVDLNSGAATVNEGVLADRAISGTIRWIPTFGLNTGDVCTFTFGNARYMSADVKLLGEEAAAQQPGTGATDINADADLLDVVEVASNFGSLDATNGVTSVQVRINNGLTLPTGINLVLAETVGVDAGPNGVLDDETMNPVLRIPAGTGVGNVTIASSCVTSGGLAIGAATASNTIIDLETQIAVTLSTAATSVADVAAATPRTRFAEEGGAGDVVTSANDTDLLASAALYAFNNDADSTVEDFITLAAGDLFSIALTSSTDLGALSTTAGASFIEEASGTVDGANYAFTLATPSMTSATIAGNAMAVRGAAESDDIVLTVDGATTIADRTFTGVATLNFAGAQYADQTYNLGTTHTWTTNGTILETAQFTNGAGYNNRFVFMNYGGSPASYSAECIVETGKTAVAGSAASGTLDAGAQTVILSSDVCTISGTATATGNTAPRGGARFTINAPSAMVKGVYNSVNTTTGAVDSVEMVRPTTNVNQD